MAESSGFPEAKSKKGAGGLMQLMPKTWKMFEPEKNFYTYHKNPKENIKIGAKSLNWFANYCKNNCQFWHKLTAKEKMILTSAAYNAGQGRLKKNKWSLEKMPKETKIYVKEIIENNDYLGNNNNKVYKSF